jgi:high-affinity iron transporter
VTWADAVPNLLIGLREGLEAGLVVSILLAALRKTGGSTRVPATPVWLGVLAAVMLAAAFAAVLSLSASELPSGAQEAVGGLLSVLAVGLVTGMVFWMRRTAASLAGHLRGEVERAVAIGAGALTLTAFLAVGREGLETTLFLWTAAQATGSTAGPIAGAALGLAAAVALCWLLYRRAIRLNVGVFFSRTAIALIVIAAGVLAYGLGDLQDAGLLPGQRWIAFDLTAHVDPGSWWVTVVTGITELAPRMTVLQVVAWLAYLGVVLPLFLRSGAAARPAAAQTAVPAVPAGRAAPAAAGRVSAWWERLAGRRPWVVASLLVAVPVLAAAVIIAVLPPASSSASTAVTVTRTGCADGWTSAGPGTQTFTVRNQSGRVAEINLDDAAGAVVAEIETLGPATAADMTATLGRGAYRFTCYVSGQAALSSDPVQVTGPAATARIPAAVRPPTVAELTGPNRAYQAYAARQLAALSGAVATIDRDLQAGAGRSEVAGLWLAAQLDWERVGASYDSFGNAGAAVDGLPGGLPGGVHDPAFTGLHRLEYGLWHGEARSSLRKVVTQLERAVAAVRQSLTTADLAGDPANLPVRAHEILEDALRDHLSGLDDQGGGAAYPETYADAQVTREVLGELAAPITARAPRLLATARSQLGTLQRALLATQHDGRWQPPDATPLASRQRVNAALGALLQTLSSVPDLLEVPPTP